MCKLKSAYGRGLDAAYRQGEYAGDTRSSIPCPYGAGTPEAEAWHEGFGDAMDDLTSTGDPDV